MPSRAPPTAGPPPAAVLRGVHAGGARGGLHGVDLDLAAGECLVLLGPDGAGKAAVLDLLAGFAGADAGDVLLEGRPATGVPPHRRGLGLVLREDGPLARLTVAGTIGFALVARGGAGGADEVGAIMQALGLAGLGDRRAETLAPDPRVRTALARALVGRPRLVLLDEPFAALDPAGRDAVIADLRPVLATAGAACVLTTRDAGLALAWGGRVAVIDLGVVLQTGPVQAVYDSPLSERVGRLLGEVNCLPGRVEAVEDDAAVVRLTCGITVEADASGALPGRACRVLVRPERIAVAAGAADEMGAGALPATVLALAWRGDHVRLTLALGTGEPATLLVTRPAGVPLAGLAPGRPAAIAWQTRHARVVA